MATVRVVHNPATGAWLRSLADELTDRAVDAVAADARRYAPVRTGLLVSRIEADKTADRVWARTGYAVYVELGTRHMQPQPYLRPALFQRRVLA